MNRKQKKNLITLANGLMNFDVNKYPNVRFEMLTFGNCYNYNEQENECGTVGCALGHAPLFGFKYIPMYEIHPGTLTERFNPKGERWEDFGKRVFGVSTMFRNWDWLFAGGWTIIDNTRRGAAQRIIYMLQYGVPEDWSYDRDTIDLYKDITGFCPQWLKENSHAE